MRRNRLLSTVRPGMAVFLLAGVISMAVFSSTCSGRDSSGEPEYITFGAIPSGSAALIYIAQDQGFFQSEGLVVDVKDYPTGIATTEALLAAEVDIAWAAEFPILSRAFAGEEISIFAVSSRFADQFLFILKEYGINKLSNLKGKTIGLPLKTIAEFYLARFLNLNGIGIQEVALINVLPSQAMEVLTKGAVAGVVTWEPYTSNIKEQLVDRIVDWPIQNSQPGFGVMIGRNNWLTKRPEVVERFLVSLTRAEAYFVQHTEAAKDIIQKRVSYDDALMDTFLSENRFELSLDQSLILAMEDEARWMIANNLTTEKIVPDFLDYIYEDGLRKVKPAAVNIIR